jgi:hypothetical protein
MRRVRADRTGDGRATAAPDKVDPRSRSTLTLQVSIVAARHEFAQVSSPTRSTSLETRLPPSSHGSGCKRSTADRGKGTDGDHCEAIAARRAGR